ncbi:MAG: NADH-quinone oxidoreductase subunit J family protein [Acidimicrobiales bacterium]
MIDWFVFAVSGAAVLIGALGVVLARNPVHSALMLVMTLFGVAVLFVAQAAHFLAAVQVIVYAGAIVVLFLFVIMLLGIDKSEESRADPIVGQRPLAVLAGIGVLGGVLLIARATWVSGIPSDAGPLSGPGSNVAKLARVLFSRYLLAFEVTSLLLVIAVVGAVVLTRHDDSDDSDPDLADSGLADSGTADSGPADSGPADSGLADFGAAQSGEVGR